MGHVGWCPSRLPSRLARPARAPRARTLPSHEYVNSHTNSTPGPFFLNRFKKLLDVAAGRRILRMLNAFKNRNVGGKR